MPLQCARRLLQSPTAAASVASPLINVMLNADSLVAIPLLLLLQANRSPLHLADPPAATLNSSVLSSPQNLSDIDCGLAPYALLNLSGERSRTLRCSSLARAGESRSSIAGCVCRPQPSQARVLSPNALVARDVLQALAAGDGSLKGLPRDMCR